MPVVRFGVHRREHTGARILAAVDAAWAERVRAALLAGDGAALTTLFDAAVAAEGREAASRSWLEAIAAFDAEAITG
jgi:hypothetical protein